MKMKWWGWGDTEKLFDIQDKPALCNYMVKSTGIKDDITLR
jgi:hypothetical protein